MSVSGRGRHCTRYTPKSLLKSKSSKSYGEEKLIIGKRNGLETGTDREEVITYLEDNSWKDEIDEFAEAIVENKIITNGSVEDALETMRLVYKIYWADEKWRYEYNIQKPDSL